MSTVATARLLRLDEVAERLNISRATSYRMVADGRLPAIQLGGPGAPLRVAEDELRAWLYGLPDAGASPFRARELPAERGDLPSGQSTSSPTLAGLENER